MYDLKRRSFDRSMTVKDLIEKLKEYPQDAKIAICGDDYCYIHVETNNSVVCLDNEDLEECYDATFDGTVNDLIYCENYISVADIVKIYNGDKVFTYTGKECIDNIDDELLNKRVSNFSESLAEHKKLCIHIYIENKKEESLEVKQIYSLEAKNEKRYVTKIEIYESSLIHECEHIEPCVYLLVADTLEEAKNIYELLFQAIEIDQLDNRQLRVLVSIKDNENPDFKYEHIYNVDSKIKRTDIPSKYIVWGNKTPHIYSINRNRSTLYING